MKNRLLSGILFLAGTVMTATEPNLWPNPGFESWNETDNKPASPAWRWSIQKMKGGNEFAFLGRTSEEKHSGNYSLRM